MILTVKQKKIVGKITIRSSHSLFMQLSVDYATLLLQMVPRSPLVLPPPRTKKKNNVPPFNISTIIYLNNLPWNINSHKMRLDQVNVTTRLTSLYCYIDNKKWRCFYHKRHVMTIPWNFLQNRISSVRTGNKRQKMNTNYIGIH